MRSKARQNAAPELLSRRDQNAKVKRVHRDIDLDPFASPCDDRKHRALDFLPICRDIFKELQGEPIIACPDLAMASIRCNEFSLGEEQGAFFDIAGTKSRN